MTSPDTMVGGVSARRIAEVRAREAATFTAARPKTEAALRSGASAFLDGVPMLWMKDWPQPFPMVVAEAKGASSSISTATGSMTSASATPARCSAIRPRRSPRPSANRPNVA
jgi:hypothetical protein